MERKDKIDKERHMKKAKFRCKKCGKKFVKEIFEDGEAEAKKLPTSTIRCPDPECRGPVERI